MISVKRFLWVSLPLLLCLSLSACSSQNTPSPLHELVDNGATEEYSAPAATHDYVIVPEASGNVLVERARAFTSALSARTGIPTSFFFDNESLPKDDNARLILLGNTSFALSQKHLHDLRRDDYICAIDENALILGGRSDEATVAAIDRFCTELLPYADDEILINADQQFMVRSEYPVSNVTLGGLSLGDYRIVYPRENTLGEAKIAAVLREILADRCGFYPEVVSDDRISERTRIIAVGACFGEDTWEEPLIACHDTTVTLCGATQYELCASAQAFCEYLLPKDAPENVSVTITAPIPVSCGSPSVSGFVGLLRESLAETDATEAARISYALRQSCATFAPFSPTSENILFYLQLNLADYACLSVPLSDGRVLPLFYREDTLTLLEQKSAGTSCILRFQICKTDICFTVIHAFANDEETVKQMVEQNVSANEPTVLFLATSTSLPVVDTGSTAFREPHVLTCDGNRMQTLVSHATAITPPDTADAPYVFEFPHPFLAK